MSSEDTLAQMPLFSALNRKALGLLAKGAVKRQFATGDVIVKEGEQAVNFFYLLSGRVGIVKAAEGSRPKVLRTMGTGDFFGEMALLDGYLRWASVRSLEDTECLQLRRWDFLYALRTNPYIAVEMLPVLSRRLRGTNAELGT